ncbi:hypothetical protein TrRE_jg5548, partial [Triparma retinervis]
PPIALATTDPRGLTQVLVYVLPVISLLLTSVSNTTCDFLTVGTSSGNDFNIGLWKLGSKGSQCVGYGTSDAGYGSPVFSRLMGAIGMCMNIALCYAIFECYRGKFAFAGGRRTMAMLAAGGGLGIGLAILGMAVSDTCRGAENCDMGGGTWISIFAFHALFGVAFALIYKSENDSSIEDIKDSAKGEGYTELGGKGGEKEMTEVEKWTM